jgi:fructokinase
LDVVGVGNALVDVISLEQDGFLAEHGLTKGAMTLVDPEQAERLYAAMGPGLEASGGSAANTLAGLASLGGSGGFIGRVRDDQLGAVFGHDIRAIGVEFPGAAATTGSPTGRCLIVVTPTASGP